MADQSRVEEATRWFDGKIAELGEDFVDVLGKGTRADLDAAGPSYAKRAEIASKVSVLREGYRATGAEVPSRDALFAEASRVVLGEKVAEVEKVRAAGKLQQRSTQHINRPGRNKHVAKVSAEDEVAAELDAKYFNKK